MRPAYTLPFAFTLALTILLTAGAVSAAETSEHACACPEHALYHPDNLAGHHDKPAFPARTANLLDSFFNDAFLAPFHPLASLGGGGLLPSFSRDIPGAGAALLPRIDVSESDTSVSVVAELPGIRREDVSVSVKDDVLTLRGEKKEAREEGGGEGERWHRMERSFGVFERAMRLPKDVDPEKVKAKYSNGVLTVTFEKMGKAKREGRTIEIGE